MYTQKLRYLSIPKVNYFLKIKCQTFHLPGRTYLYNLLEYRYLYYLGRFLVFAIHVHLYPIELNAELCDFFYTQSIQVGGKKIL